MFRPFIGEIIDAKLKEFDKDGLRCMSQSARDTKLHLLLLLYSECQCHPFHSGVQVVLDK